MTARSTTIRLMLEHCPRAVDHYQAGVEQDRRVFHVGTAAHDVLQAMGERRDVAATCIELIARGRSGHDAEGPLPARAVLEGRDLAEAWALRWPLPEPGPGVWYELGIGLHEGWRPCAYEDATWLESRIDIVQIYPDEDEDGADVNVLEIGDYKTSWHDRDVALGSLQRKIQTLACVAVLDRLESQSGQRIDAIEQVVHNLRTRCSYRRRLSLHEDHDLLEAWRREVELLVAAHDSAPRGASPGPACIGCPYAATCPDALQLGEGDAPAALRYAALRASAKEAERAARDELGRRGRLVTPDGGAVGFLSYQKRQAEADAMERAWAWWQKQSPTLAFYDTAISQVQGLDLAQRDAAREVLRNALASQSEQVRGMLRAMGRPSIVALEQVVRQIEEDPIERKRVLDRWISMTAGARWSVDPPGTHEVDDRKS